MDLRRSLGSILDAASAGERFIVERDHRPLAMIVSIEEGSRLEDSAEERRARILAALDRGDEFRARMARKYPPMPGDLDAAAAIRADRDRDELPHPHRG
jgi:antitoxin (DNA-binding transcriptional repressor) of toxin-antitoxin stability system